MSDWLVAEPEVELILLPKLPVVGRVSPNVLGTFH